MIRPQSNATLRFNVVQSVNRETSQYLFSEKKEEDLPFFGRRTRIGFEWRFPSRNWQILNETILPHHHTP